MKKILLVIFVLILAAGLAYSSFKKEKKKNIVFILIDTLRADHLSLYGYERKTSPNLDVLANESAVFTRAFSAASWTPPGTTSVLSGLYPTAHTNQPPKRLTDAKQTGIKIPKNIKLLPEILKAQGYQTSALSSNPWITKEFDFDRGFDNFYFSKHLDSKGIIDRSKKSINRFLENPDNPFFLYLHLIDPHAPYTAHADFKYEGKLAVREYSETALADINAYDSEIAYTDYNIGRLFDFLKEKKLFEDSIVVIVADHGEAFDEHGITGHGFHLHVEEVGIPLIIKGIDLKGSFDQSVSQVDVVPTLLEYLKIPEPYPLAGISLRDEQKLNQRSGVYSENYRIYRQRAFSSGQGERLIMQMGDIEKPTEVMSKKGMYNLNSDALEQAPLEDAMLETELKAYLDQKIADNVPKSEVKEVQIDNQTLKQLETLGYIN